jgi:uncharacterized protein (UPF0332 family)
MANQPFDWTGYLALAQEFATRNEEACLRSSVSRAYYFVYNLALSRAERNGFVYKPGESTHVQLWRLFSKSPEPECFYLGQIALRMKQKRKMADYGSFYRRIEEEVPQVLLEARNFAARLGKLAPRHPDPSSIRL